MSHSLLLCKRLQFGSDLFVLMHTIGWFVVTVVAKPYHKPKLVRLVPERTAENVMPFKPMP
jgi:hypothetical protein